jgi:hypothetical protein
VRKEIGHRVRQLMFAGIPETLPGFAPSKEGGIPGHYWVFSQADATGRIWYLAYQQHWYEDWFTLELAWSSEGKLPSHCPDGDPDTFPKMESGRFRVGRFWTPEDVWWQVAPAVHASSIEETLGRVEANVEDALRKLHDHVRPWLEGR